MKYAQRYYLLMIILVVIQLASMKLRIKEAHVIHTSPIIPDKVVALLDVDKLHHHIHNGFMNAQIPIVGLLFPSGLDGSTRTIEYGWANIGYAKVSWWGSGPPEWKLLDDWFSTFTQFLDVALFS